MNITVGVQLEFKLKWDFQIKSKFRKGPVLPILKLQKIENMFFVGGPNRLSMVFFLE